MELMAWSRYLHSIHWCIWLMLEIPNEISLVFFDGMLVKIIVIFV